jgi:prolipoprotein diacylglyceryltransferase
MMPRVGYAVFMLLAVGMFLLARRVIPKPRGLTALPPATRFVLGAVAFIGGSLGAKVPFALGADSGPLSAAAWFSDGKTIMAGLIGAYLAVELAKLFLGIRVKTGDSFALPLALALFVGRWGCFLNGCCFGLPTALPWGADFGDGVLRHPTQAYESLFHLTMAFVLYLLLRRQLLAGHHLQLYLIAYCVYRFLTEYIRPEPIVGLSLTLYQWLCLVLASGLIAQWATEAQAGDPGKDELNAQTGPRAQEG